MRGPWFGVAGAALGTLVISSVAVADIPDGNVFHACIRVNEDTQPERPLRLIDTSGGATCRKDEVAVTWNAVGPAGAQGPVGPQGPAGPAGSVLTVFMNRNFEDIPTNAYLGVTVAHVDLGPGTYVLQAKLRYLNVGSSRQTGACIFQGSGIGDLDGSQQNVEPGGELSGQVDGSLLDIVIKRAGDSTDVHLQCFGPGDGSIHIINAQLMATLPGTVNLR